LGPEKEKSVTGAANAELDETKSIAKSKTNRFIIEPPFDCDCVFLGRKLLLP